jgi:hydroxymethylbilane synthase
MHQRIRIGTRDSRLAVWQAEWVKSLLAAQDCSADLVRIKSEGDLDQVSPLYSMGVQGIFTRTLDQALLAGRIDLAVHSLKDVPLDLAQGIRAAATLERGPALDLLVFGQEADFLERAEADVATGSMRRTAQWLNRYPGHRIHDLRGNVDTRLKKLRSGTWDAALFAQAGLERIGLRPLGSLVLDWMLPAPGQGAILVVCRSDDEWAREICLPLDHRPSALSTEIEREFLRALMGQCSTPIGALAEWNHGQVRFRGNLVSPDGKEKVEVETYFAASQAAEAGRLAAAMLLDRGGRELADRIRMHGE